jgi:hypothetical protein
MLGVRGDLFVLAGAVRADGVAAQRHDVALVGLRTEEQFEDDRSRISVGSSFGSQPVAKRLAQASVSGTDACVPWSPSPAAGRPPRPRRLRVQL